MSKLDFENASPPAPALGDARVALARMAAGGLAIVVLIVGLLVYAGAEEGAAPGDASASADADARSTDAFGGGVAEATPQSALGLPAELSVQAIPAGAIVYVDGDSVGTAPSWQGQVPEGERWVRVVTAAGAVVADTLVWVEAGVPSTLGMGAPRESAAVRTATDTPRPTPPAAGSGRLRVTSSPDGAEVQLNGRAAGTTPLTLDGLRPGAYGVSFTRRGYESVVQQIQVRAGGDSEVAVSLRPSAPAPERPVAPRAAPSRATPSRAEVPRPAAPAPAAVTGTVEILVRPWGRILVDGVPRTQETAVVYRIELGAGVHRIEALHPQLGSQVQTITVVPDSRLRVVLDLTAGAGG